MGTPFLDIPDVDVNDPRPEITTFLAQRLGLPPSVIAGAIAGAFGIPTTRAKLTHAYKLQTSRGRTIGAVFRTEMRQGRDVDDEFEIDVNAHGEPADIVPQVLRTRTFAIARFDLYEEVMTKVFGAYELNMLTDQRRGFKIREVWRAPTSILNSRGALYEYFNCWFTDLGDAKEATGERTVRVNAELRWQGRWKIA